MTRPRLLDLFCCAGGAAEGYRRAGFDVLGVDIRPQPRYPFLFVQAEVLSALASWNLTEFAAIHASPPCQAYSDLAKRNPNRRKYDGDYPDLIQEVRIALKATGLPFVIENVEGAPLQGAITLCGAMREFPDLRVIRHRLFECSFPVRQPLEPAAHPIVFTYDKRKQQYKELDAQLRGRGLAGDELVRARADAQNASGTYVSVTGGGNSTLAKARIAMGIDWMTKEELNEAIPPAFTEYIGRSLLEPGESDTLF